MLSVVQPSYTRSSTYRVSEVIRRHIWEAPHALTPASDSWNTEALHGLAADCLTVDGVTRCPTVFPVGPGMGATFNLSLAGKMGVAISDEARAMNNLGGCRNRGSGGCGWGNGNWYIGLNVWVPNLNINRDPRWGRNIEGSQSPARGLPTVPPSRPPLSATSSAGRACRH